MDHKMHCQSPDRRMLRSNSKRFSDKRYFENVDNDTNEEENVRSPMRPEIKSEAERRKLRFENRQRERSNRFSKVENMRDDSKPAVLATQNHSENRRPSASFHESPNTTTASCTDWGSIMENEQERGDTDDDISEVVSSLKPRFSKSFLKDPSKRENDPEILQRRQKQIDYGKNTPEYNSYLSQVPRSERTKFHPFTPEKNAKYSRRSWDMMIRIWRKQLHIWDPKPNQAQ